MKKWQLTELRLQLAKLVLDLELAESQADKRKDLVSVSDVTVVALENTVRDLKNWRGI